MEQVNFTVTKREATGKSPARRLRAQGLVPGVVYGMAREPIPIQTGQHDLHVLLSAYQSTNVLLNLKIEGCEVEGAKLALLKDVTRHPVTQAPESIDFQWVDLNKPISLSIPIVVDGTAAGTEEGGVVEYGLSELSISCLPGAIPDAIHVDVTNLQVNEAIHVRDLEVPPEVQIQSNPDEVVVSCSIPRVIVEEEEVPAEEEVLAEGEEPEEGAEEAAEGEEAAKADETAADSEGQ